MFARKVQDQFSPTEVTRTEKFLIEGVGEPACGYVAPGCGYGYVNPGCGYGYNNAVAFANGVVRAEERNLYRTDSYVAKLAATEAAMAAADSGARSSKGAAWGFGIGSLILVMAGIGATAYAASRASTLTDEKNANFGKLLGWGVDSGIPTRINNF